MQTTSNGARAQLQHDLANPPRRRGVEHHDDEAEPDDDKAKPHDDKAEPHNDEVEPHNEAEPRVEADPTTTGRTQRPGSRIPTP